MKISEKEKKRIDEIHNTQVAKSSNIEGYQHNTTFFVSDYSQFEHTDANRAVLPSTELFENLKANGQLVPVMVQKNENGKLVIIDGQHRTFHLKELELPVLCLETNFKGDDFEAVKAMNIVSKSFTNKDLSLYYIKKGNQDFKNFNEAKQAYKFLSETILYTEYAKGKKEGLKKMYAAEKLEFELTEAEKAELTILNQLMEAISDSRDNQPFNGYFSRREIFKTLKSFISTNPDTDTLIETLKEKGHSLTKESTTEDISELYHQRALINEQKRLLNH